MGIGPSTGRDSNNGYQKRLGEELEKLCTINKCIAASICKIFKVELNGREVAIKQIPHDEGSGRDFDYMIREWEIQIKLEHENVLKLEGIGYTTNFK